VLSSAKDLERIEYAFVKPKATEVRTIRGYRHTLKTDTIFGPFGAYVEKSPIHAVVSSVLGTPLIEVASGPEHQGPLGHHYLPSSPGLARQVALLEVLWKRTREIHSCVSSGRNCGGKRSRQGLQTFS